MGDLLVNFNSVESYRSFILRNTRVSINEKRFKYYFITYIRCNIAYRSNSILPKATYTFDTFGYKVHSQAEIH